MRVDIGVIKGARTPDAVADVHEEAVEFINVSGGIFGTGRRHGFLKTLLVLR